MKKKVFHDIDCRRLTSNPNKKTYTDENAIFTNF